MSHRPITPDGLFSPRGHYSPAVVHNNTVYVSGQLAVRADGTVALDSVEAEVEQCMANISTILQAAGSGLEHILRVQIFVTDMALWARVNASYAAIMGEHRPARLIIPCGPLNRGCSVEIDCIAAVASHD
jgi:2-iminobutanoate/2-iminopropanoate deaminase